MLLCIVLLLYVFSFIPLYAFLALPFFYNLTSPLLFLFLPLLLSLLPLLSPLLSPPSFLSFDFSCCTYFFFSLKISCVTPAHEEGTVQVTVTLGEQTSSESVEFTYDSNLFFLILFQFYFDTLVFKLFFRFYFVNTSFISCSTPFYPFCFLLFINS
jgi:hypothetical protein